MRPAFAIPGTALHAAFGAAALLAASTALTPQAAEAPLDLWEVQSNTPTLGRPVFGNGRFVAWDGTGADKSYFSPDGSVWTSVSQFPYSGGGLILGSGLFLHYRSEVGPPGAMITSEDGEQWAFATDDYFVSVVWPWRGRFWALEYALSQQGVTGSKPMTSPDGRTWARGGLVLPFYGAGRYPFVVGGGRTLGLASLASTGQTVLVLTEDGQSWSVLANVAGVEAFLSGGLAYGNGTYLWLANPKEPESSQQVVFTSTNGMDWSPQATPSTNELSGIAYGNKTFVAAGDNGTLLTSPDGTNWTARSSGTAAKLSHAVFGGGRFVLTGEAVVRSAVQPQAVGEIRFMPWLCRRLSDGAMLLTVEGPYGRPVVVAASEDMVNWEEIATDPCDRGEFEVYDEAAAGLPHRFYRAVKWEPPPPPDDPLLNWSVADTVLEEGQTVDWNLAYGNGVFVAAGKKNDNSGSAWYSEGGFTWQPSNSTASHENVTFGAGRFVSTAGATPMSTVNGQDWIQHEPFDRVVYGAMLFGRGRFGCMVPRPNDQQGHRPTWFMSSADGAEWETNVISLDILIEIQSVYPKSVAYAKGRMVVLDSFKIISSADGQNWDVGPWYQPDIVAPSPELDFTIYGKGRFVAKGYQKLLTSEDGVTWAHEDYSSPQPSLATYANGTFVGESWNSSKSVSQLYGSADGLTWTNLVEVQTSGTPTDLLFAEGRFHLVTWGGEVWRSAVMPPHVTEPRVIPELTYPLADGAMLVTVEAPYGHEVVVEGSEDLEAWQEIGRDSCDRGEFEIYHETAPAGTDWFYRARQVEP